MKTKSQPRAAGEAAHSPTPWSEDPEGETAITLEDANGQPICDVYLPDGAKSADCPNAAFIVRACNSHAELLAFKDAAIVRCDKLHADKAALVAALETSLRSLDSLCHACFEAKAPVFGLIDPRKAGVIEQARVALASAK